MMQQKLSEAQEELEETVLTGIAGNGLVTVKVNGKGKIQSLSIKPEAVDPSDVEMLEDLLMAAINDAVSQADELSSELLGPLGGGGGLF